MNVVSRAISESVVFSLYFFGWIAACIFAAVRWLSMPGEIALSVGAFFILGTFVTFLVIALRSRENEGIAGSITARLPGGRLAKAPRGIELPQGVGQGIVRVKAGGARLAAFDFSESPNVIPFSGLQAEPATDGDERSQRVCG